MSYRRRSVRIIASKSKKNFLTTLIITVVMGLSLIWLLPQFINIVGSIKETVKPAEKTLVEESDTAGLPPPILNIPFEATNTSEIDITGYSTANSKVKLFLDETEVEVVDVTTDGSFIFRNVSLNLGTNNFYGKTLDEEGKESLPSKTIRILYDNEKPSLEVRESEDNRNISGERKIKISGVTEINAQIYINGSQVIVDKEGNFQTELMLNDGENIFNIKAQDSASNSTEISRRVNFTP